MMFDNNSTVQDEDLAEIGTCITRVEIYIAMNDVKGFDIGRGEDPETRKKDKGGDKVIELTKPYHSDKATRIEGRLRREFWDHIKFRGRTDDGGGGNPKSDLQIVYLLLFYH